MIDLRIGPHRRDQIPAAPCENPECGTVWGFCKITCRRASRKNGLCSACIQLKKYRQDGSVIELGDELEPHDVCEPTAFEVVAWCQVFRNLRPRSPAGNAPLALLHRLRGLTRVKAHRSRYGV